MYDAWGNITSGYGGGLTLVYDAENRLVSAGENLRGQVEFKGSDTFLMLTGGLAGV